ncbi:hypothetical protein SAMN05444161_9052 [Rhizobiales bacterium GAS191]|nr:hypothetical protein SAMN05519104_8067 [Rhizobiales bacterium GAS188]SEF14777.1 hypothetical protein SAMN05444161_9052 [Rhizobiales bacterium GAS191]
MPATYSEMMSATIELTRWGGRGSVFGEVSLRTEDVVVDTHLSQEAHDGSDDPATSHD